MTKADEAWEREFAEGVERRLNRMLTCQHEFIEQITPHQGTCRLCGTTVARAR